MTALRTHDLGGAVRLGAFTAPSRVLFGPIETNLGEGRALSARHTAFYARRAAGGTGVIVSETASVHDSDWPYERAPLASACAPGWASIVAACRPDGALVLAGLGHAGGQGSSAHHRRVLWAPSGVPSVAGAEVPYAVERPEIDELVAGFAAAARAAVAVGCHGVEINAGQHSILRQFLSGLTNRRVDGYGSDRARLVREVLSAVRDAVGPEAVLGLRLCVDELAPWGGLTPSEVGGSLPSLVAGVDYLVPVRGGGLSESATRPDGHTPPGVNRAPCAGVRAGVGAVGGTAVGPSVVLQGSVVDVSMAAGALADGTADLVEMTRAQLADPDLVALTRAGHASRIRPCTLSNQHSLVRGSANLVIGDEAEPASGYETEVPAPRRGRPGEVLVVGGGPGGMEAARVAALRGHRVRLVERSERLGGGLWPAEALPGRARFGLLRRWWGEELRRLGVDVRTGATVGAAELDAATRDGVRVLLCTGSRPAAPGFAVGTGATVEPAGEWLAAMERDGGVDLPAGADVVVWDPVGDWVGVGVSELITGVGARCTLVTPDPVPGARLSRTGDLTGANTRLHRAGVARAGYSRLCSVGDGRADLVDVHTGRRRTVPATLVVDCGHRLPEDTLWRIRPDLPRAGDAVAPRTVAHAVREAREVTP
jgi:2,4-dienoyl-CoA reductase (NADPH2)